MMKIESVSSQPDRVGRHTVRFEDGTVMRLYRQTVEDFGIYPGQEFSPDEISRLREAAGAMSAKMRAVRIVAASNVSCRSLERKLIQKGESPHQAKDAVQWMSDLQLVDDRRTANQIVQRCANKGYGIARAKQALYEKQIPKVYWEEALESYPDQTESIVAFLKTRLGDDWDQKDLHRAMDALVRRGHSYSEIRKALTQLSLDTNDFPEG